MLDGKIVTNGNVELMMSHVLPDLVKKMISGQHPLHIFGSGQQTRCYTNGKDIALGICLAVESPDAINQAFNISTSRATTVKELAESVWAALKISQPLKIVHDEPYKFDILTLVPDTQKAKNILGFEAKIPLEASIREVINYVKNKQA